MNNINIKELVRDNILKLQPYSSARVEYEGDANIWLDANENPFGLRYNRYPDPFQCELKKVLSTIKNVSSKQIFIGNGSDEVIDLLIRAFCEPGIDSIITFNPSYTMYITSATINNVRVREFLLTEEFQIPLTVLKQNRENTDKLLFICTPNNPIGNLIPLSVIEQVCRLFTGIVVVDEAYLDFSNSDSAIKLLDKYNNLFIVQTLSKAYGMAGLRLGIGIGNPEIIEILNRIKPPYNVSQSTQDLVLDRLNYLPEIKTHIQLLIKERNLLYNDLIQLSFFNRVFESEANFILVQTPHYKELYDFLCSKGIVVRIRNIPPSLLHGLRLTVGLPVENKKLMESLLLFKRRIK